MADRAIPDYHVFSDDDSFDDPANIHHLNRNVQMMQAKFGVLTYDDFYTVLTPEVSLDGSVDMRANLVTNCSGALNVIPLHSQTTHGLVWLMNNMQPGVIFVEPGTNYYMATKVVFRSGIQIIGGGPTSQIWMSSTTNAGPHAGFRMFEVPKDVKNWAIRNVRINGAWKAGLANPVQSGWGLYVRNARDTNGEVENVDFGPQLHGAKVGKHHNPIEIINSSGIRFTNVCCRYMSNTGVKIVTTKWTSICKDIEFYESAIEHGHNTGVLINGCSVVKFGHNFIGLNGQSNVVLKRAKHAIFHENKIYNASTGTAPLGQRINVYLSHVVLGATSNLGCVFMNNEINDIRERGVYSKSSGVQAWIGIGARSFIFMQNFMNSGTDGGGAAPQDLIYEAVNLANRQISRDQNIGQDWRFYSRQELNPVQRHSNANAGVSWQNWKCVDFRGEAGVAGVREPGGDYVGIMTYSRRYSDTMANRFDDIVGGGIYEGGFRYPVPAGTVDLPTSKIIEYLGNVGSILTPERLYCRQTNSADSIRAAIGTYNLGPFMVNGEPLFTPNKPIGGATGAEIFPFCKDPTGAKVIGGSMGDSVICINAVSATNLCIAGCPRRVKDFHGGNATVLLGRPTWVTVRF